jgi:hypothetical protein
VVMALAEALHSLLRLPGATYSCVVERDSGRVLAEAGRGEDGAGDGEGVVPYSVARWGTAVAAMFDATSADELDDVMITGRRSYHLLRSLGPSASVLVYLRLDRPRSNLAAARRELATVRWGMAGHSSAPPPTAPADRGAGSSREATSPAATAGSGARPRAAGSTTRRPAEPPKRSTPGAATRVPAALPPTGTPARGVPTTGRGAGSATSSRSAAKRPAADRPAVDPAAVDPAAVDRAAVDRAAVDRAAVDRPAVDRPAAHRPAAVERPAAGRPVASRAARDAEPPAAAPQIPLPRRAPGNRSSAWSATPAPTGGTAGRGGGAREARPAEGSKLPDGFPVPALVGKSWARDPGTLRRLIAGLRRMA